MPQFTGAEIFWLLVIIAVIFAVAGCIFKTAIKVFLTISVCCLICSIGFGWLPEQFDQVKNGDKTTNEVINEVIVDADKVLNEAGDVFNVTVDYVEENKDEWLDSLESLFVKLADWINTMGQENKETNTDNTTGETLEFNTPEINEIK